MTTKPRNQQQTKHSTLFLIGLVVLSLLVTSTYTMPTVQATTTTTVTLTSNIAQDGEIYNDTTAAWNVKQAALDGVVNSTGTHMYIGSVLTSPPYLYRGFLFFDITSIPIGANITQAIVSVNVLALFSTSGVTLQSGMPNYPNNPMQNTDFNQAYYTTTLGSSAVGGAGVLNVTLNADGIAALTDASLDSRYFIACARSSDDVANTTSGSDYIKISSSEAGAATAPKLYVTYTTEDYYYTFNGVYDETTGVYDSACNVTAYFNTAEAQTFVLNGTRTATFAEIPRFCSFDVSPYPREYWFEPAENASTIYVYTDTTSLYTIQFNDLVGKLQEFPYIEISFNVGGADRIVQKVKVDVENKIIVPAVQGRTYTITVGDYDYGDLLFGSTSPITLNLRGLDFPDTIDLGYRYVRIYVTRDQTTTEITLTYEDEKNATVSVVWAVYYLDNDTLVYTDTGTAASWVTSWAGSDADTDYYAVVQVTHSTYGVLDYRQGLPRTYAGSSPFDLSVLGTLDFDTAYIIPAFIILCSAGAFSAVNLVFGALVVVVEAAAFAYLGWLPLSVDLIVFAFALVVILALVMVRRR